MGFSLIFLKYGNIVVHSLGVAGNLVIIAMVMAQDDQYIKKYSSFLLQTTILEAILALAALIILPITGKTDDVFYAFSCNPFINSEAWSLLITMTIYFSIILTSVGGAFIPFYIRYLIIVRKRVISTRFYYSIYGGLIALFNVIFAIIFFILRHGTVVFGNYTRMIGSNSLFTGQLFVTFLSIILFVMAGASAAIIYRIHHRILKELASKNVFMHVKIKTLSKVLQETLYAQNFCLLIGAGISAFILFVSSFIPCDHCISYGLMFVTWASLANPLCVLIMMKAFRETLTRKFAVFCFKQPEQISSFSMNANYLNQH